MNTKKLPTLRSSVLTKFICLNIILTLFLLVLWQPFITIPLNYKISITCLSVSISFLKMPEYLRYKFIGQFSLLKLGIIIILIYSWKILILFSLKEKIIIACVISSILLLGLSNKFKSKMDIDLTIFNMLATILFIGLWKFYIPFPLKYKVGFLLLIINLWLVALSKSFKFLHNKLFKSLSVLLYVLSFYFLFFFRL